MNIPAILSFKPLQAFRLRRCLRMAQSALVLLAVLGLDAAFSLNAVAAEKSVKTLLIINSYEETELWSNEMVRPITTYLSMVDSVDCDIVNLNSSIIADSATYNTMADNIFRMYAATPPEYLVLIGNYAFLLRDRIKQEWGDIPMLLFSRITNSQTLEDSFTSNDSYVDLSAGTPLELLRGRYNFTAVVIPDNTKETVELMVKTVPDMKELVFFSTKIYVARYSATEARNTLQRLRPDVRFTWMQASKENSPRFREYMTLRQDDKAMLLSTWVYEKESTRGYPMLTASDLQLIMSTKTPVFALHDSYRVMGCVGGVYGDVEKMGEYVTNVVRQMLHGKSMRDIPFYCDTLKVPHMNYRLMQEYGISPSLCPDNTVFYAKPESPLDKFFWPGIVVILTLAILAIILAWKTTDKNKKIKLLEENKAFINNMPVPFSKADIQFDGNGNVKNISYTIKNEAFQKLIDTNSEPDSPFLLFPADYISKKVSEMLQGEKSVTFTRSYDDPESHYEFLLCSVGRPMARYSTLKAVDIFATNLTAQHELEKQLRHINDLFNMTLDASKIIPWEWDVRNGDITFYDRDMLQHIVARRKEGKGLQGAWEIRIMDFTNMVHPDDRDKLVMMRIQLEEGRFDKNTQLLLRVFFNESPEPDWVELRCFNTEIASDGVSLTVMGSMAIVTDKIKADNALLEALEMAKESDRMKSTFLANMSHEIRTPLNAIVGFSNLMAEGVEEAERIEFRDIINRNNDLLLSLINDVLDLAKIESNTIDLHYSPTSLNDILATAEQTVKFRLQPGVKMMMRPGMERCVTETDATRLTQVLVNLMTNACKFTSAGSITVGYELRSEQQQLYFYVRDTGTGIDEEGQKVIFEQFVKLNDFAQGTGLGLPICKNLVELLGGEIGVESEGLYKGSCFWFTLPYKPCGVEEAADSMNAEDRQLLAEDAIAKAATDATATGEKPVVLVAEDNISNYILLEHLLKGAYTLQRASNGVEAVEMFRQCAPKFVLMDIGMPVMDGYEATRRIREINGTVPIIAVTAFAYEADKQRILSNGFNGYVSKPVSQKELNAAIQSVLGGGKAQIVN